jgi:hypothetical protein
MSKQDMKHSSTRWGIGAVCLAMLLSLMPSGFALAAADNEWGPTYTPSPLGIAGVGDNNPVIYDNDMWNDTIDVPYLFAQHKLGRVDLRAMIVTIDPHPSPKGKFQPFSVFAKDYDEARNLAVASGITTAPAYTAGSETILTKPEDGKISSTACTPSDGSNKIVAEARAASPDKKLIVFCGGQLTTIATALLQDPSIAENMIVMESCGKSPSYNLVDGWAAYIVAMRCPYVTYDGMHHFGITKEMVAQLPQNPLLQRHRKGEFLINGLGDGRLLVWYFNKQLISNADKYTSTGPTTRSDGNGWRFAETDAVPYGFLFAPVSYIDGIGMAQAMIDVLKDPAVYSASPTTAPHAAD